MQGHRRVAIINDADHLNVESANCLLKTLEEPPAHSVIILIGTSEQRQLPTIRSRCQTVRFSGLDTEFVRDYLIKEGLSEETAAQAAQLAEGSLDLAHEFADAERMEFRTELWSTLGRSEAIRSQALAKLVSDFVDAAGKETQKRREQLRHVIRLFMVFYRRRLIEQSRAGESVDRVAAQVERCIQALGEVDANANLATLIECWIDDLYGAAVPQ
jgi:DNA polymerase-3 subunit delta'